MRQAAEKAQAKYKPYWKWQVEKPGGWSVIYLLCIGVQALGIFAKHSQWPILFRSPFSSGIFPIDSVWLNIFLFVFFSLRLVQLWIRVHQQTNRLFLAEQAQALQTDIASPEGVWPPPPRQPMV